MKKGPRSHGPALVSIRSDVAVAVVTAKRGGVVGPHFQFPHLKFFGCNSLFVGLDQRDFVEQPIRPAGIGDILRAVREQNFAVDAVTIPLLGAGELAELTIPGTFRVLATPWLSCP